MFSFGKTVRSLIVASGLALCGCATGLPAPSSQGHAAIEFAPCPFDTSKALLPVECGRMKVPENYDSPDRTIEIAFMIVRPRYDRDPRNPVLYLSGGPGAPSLVYAEMLIAAPQVRDVVIDREWVFYDQRGLGRSVPALRCPQGEPYLERVKACRDTLIGEGVDLSQYNSARSAQDIEALRQALGVRRWNLWGTSYGSRLAFAVARDFPSSVRSIIHDGPSDPEAPEIVDDFRGTAIALDRLFSKCAADAACSSKFPDLGTRFLAALPRLRREPLIVGDDRVDDNALVQYVRGYLFGSDLAIFERRVQNLLAHMDAAARGDAGSMRQLQMSMPEETADGTPVPSEGWYALGQNLSIECNEERSFETVKQYRQAATNSEIVRAMFGEDEGAGNLLDCALWPSGRADPGRKSRVRFDGPQLVFSGELDASLSGLSGDRIDEIYPNATNVVFRNAAHVQAEFADIPPAVPGAYRICALKLARQFLAAPRSRLDSRCAETRNLRLVE